MGIPTAIPKNVTPKTFLTAGGNLVFSGARLRAL